MYAAAINRSSPTTRSPGDVRRFAAEGVLARELGRSYQPGRDARHPWHACQGRLLPVPLRNRRACYPSDDRVFAHQGPKIRLETVVGELPAPLTRPPVAEPASHACDS